MPVKAAVVGCVFGIVVGAIIGSQALGKVAGMTAVEVAGTIVFWALAGALLGGLVTLLADGRPRWLWRLLAVVVGLAAFWILGDLFNALLMRRCYDNWETEIDRDANGVRAGCEVFQEGTGTTALLLIHGFADSPAVYRPMAGALAPMGYACYTLRLPHFAKPFDRYAVSTASGWRDQLAEQLRELRKNHRKIIVIAHSLGGAVTLDYLIDHPEAADGVVLLAPLLEVSNQRSPLLTAEMWFHLLDGTMLFTDRIAMVLPPDVHDPAALARMKEDRFIPRTIYREMFKVIDRNRERHQQFSLPLLLVLSRTDQIIDSPSAERFFKNCTSTNKKIKWVEQAGHVLPIDTGWEQLVEDIDEFVRSGPARQ